MALPLPDEPCTRRFMVPGYRRAVLEMFGKEGRDQVLAALDDELRNAYLDDSATRQDWFPTRYLIGWTFAIYEGPAKLDREVMTRFVRLQWDYTFGAVRKMLLHLAPPEAILKRAPALWKQDHTAGTLEVTIGEKSASITISDTPFGETPQARLSMAEIYRYSLEQTRATNVRAHPMAAGNRGLTIRLNWD